MERMNTILVENVLFYRIERRYWRWLPLRIATMPMDNAFHFEWWDSTHCRSTGEGRTPFVIVLKYYVYFCVCIVTWSPHLRDKRDNVGCSCIHCFVYMATVLRQECENKTKPNCIFICECFFSFLNGVCSGVSYRIFLTSRYERRLYEWLGHCRSINHRRNSE